IACLVGSAALLATWLFVPRGAPRTAASLAASSTAAEQRIAELTSELQGREAEIVALHGEIARLEALLADRRELQDAVHEVSAATDAHETKLDRAQPPA